MLSLIVAAADNNVIGKNNELLWRLPADMRFFKNTTWALPVIMGRKTYESLGKPLTGRYNIVITSKKDWQPEGLTVTHNLEDAITAAEKSSTNEIMIIGGGEIYKAALPIAGRIYLTRVHASPDGDTFFPEIDKNEWKLVSVHEVAKDEKNAFDMSFEKWERI